MIVATTPRPVKIKNTMIKNDTILSSDLELLYLTDDPDEVVDIINRHREWKKQRIAEANDVD